jgi:hypothetical protein
VGREDGKTSKRITTSETAKHKLSESYKCKKALLVILVTPPSMAEAPITA